MENKEIKQGEARQPQEGVDFKKFEYADVFFECANCGHMTVLDKGVEDGLSFVLPATDKHEWRMVCTNCQNMMRIFFRASSNETIEQVKAEKAKKEAEEKAKKKAEEKAKKDNESSKKDDKKEPSKRRTKRTERATESEKVGAEVAATDAGAESKA